WLAVDDTGGPFDGSVYLLWQKMERLPSAPGVIYFARSRDRGLTWEMPVALTSLAMSGTCLIDVGPQGEIYAAYYRDPEGMISRVSWDGGDTFGPPAKMLPEGLFSGPIEGTGIQFPGFPHLIVDRSRSAHRGNAYFVHIARGRRADGTVAKAIGLSRSMDRGLTWSASKNISNAPAGDSFFPMAAVDRVTGDLVVAWYDTRESPGTSRARIYAARSSDAGDTFTPPLAVSEELSLATAWMGDYYSLAAHDGTWVAAFSDGAGRLYVADIDLGQAKERAPRRRPTRR
ncbi:MAG TPA: sialidase family protein, partial [Thermoanaerobaculia bacterium]|nr:sialidase family protein [Thermoanaerobaculia bacterium]